MVCSIRSAPDCGSEKLGRQTINAIVFDDTDKVNELEIEIEENMHRFNLTEQELRIGDTHLEWLRNPNIFVRIRPEILSIKKPERFT